MLAKVLEEGNDSSGWWIDEKLEGNDSSGWWTTGTAETSTAAKGNPSRAQNGKNGLPNDQALDGQLCCGRQKFRQTLSLIKNGKSGGAWDYVS